MQVTVSGYFPEGLSYIYVHMATLRQARSMESELFSGDDYHTLINARGLDVG